MAVKTKAQSVEPRPETKYDDLGGIVSTVRPARQAEGPGEKARGRTGYTRLERWLIGRAGRLNYLLDDQGRYKCRAQTTPTVIRLGITNRCTAQCPYCPRDLVHGWGSGYLDWDLYRRLIDWAEANGVEVLGYALWGEPTLHPRLVEMADYAHRAGLTLRLSSNAIALKPELAEKLLVYPWQAIEFSMDGFSPEEYRTGKGVAAYEVAHRNINYFLDRSRELGSDTVFNIHFVDSGNVSFGNKLRYVRYWRERLKGLKYNTTFYYEPHNWAGAIDRADIDNGWLNRLLTKWELKKPCVYVRSLNVNFDGSAFVCGNNPFQAAKAGNIAEQSIEDIFTGPVRDRYLTANETGDFEAPGCQVCTVNSIFPLMWLKKRLVNQVVSRLVWSRSKG